jgi:hypothetical protein
MRASWRAKNVQMDGGFIYCRTNEKGYFGCSPRWERKSLIESTSITKFSTTLMLCQGLSAISSNRVDGRVIVALAK